MRIRPCTKSERICLSAFQFCFFVFVVFFVQERKRKLQTKLRTRLCWVNFGSRYVVHCTTHYCSAFWKPQCWSHQMPSVYGSQPPPAAPVIMQLWKEGTRNQSSFRILLPINFAFQSHIAPTPVGLHSPTAYIFFATFFAKNTQPSCQHCTWKFLFSL